MHQPKTMLPIPIPPIPRAAAGVALGVAALLIAAAALTPASDGGPRDGTDPNASDPGQGPDAGIDWPEGRVAGDDSEGESAPKQPPAGPAPTSPPSKDASTGDDPEPYEGDTPPDEGGEAPTCADDLICATDDPDEGASYSGGGGTAYPGVYGPQDSVDPCPDGYVEATSSGIHVRWAPAIGATSVVVHRAEGDGGYAPLAHLPGGATSYTDHDIEHGVTYHYVVVADAPSETASGSGCPLMEATAIPFFPGATSVLAMAGVAAVAVLALRRRG